MMTVGDCQAYVFVEMICQFSIRSGLTEIMSFHDNGIHYNIAVLFAKIATT